MTTAADPGDRVSTAVSIAQAERIAQTESAQRTPRIGSTTAAPITATMPAPQSSAT
ncbi:hypothetical protein JOF42_000236 [Microbacterium phyllosphaerae]|uniref:Uncharacterized protein n=1 Tax=Microbacterium phyllosphaerae TaxID=124798 RepID=A0ABS4WKL7_9MICO|nr:hypothetical protein [Microbacterium phyllosphaerae]MCS3443262.1 hypothetical protein [Microbacterium phyllosphaerae]